MLPYTNQLNRCGSEANVLCNGMGIRRIKAEKDSVWDSGFELGKFDKGLYMPVVEVSKSHGMLKVGSINPLGLKGKTLQLTDQEWYEIKLLVLWDDENKVIKIEKENVFLITPKEEVNV